MNNRLKDFALTQKWNRRIKGWAVINKMPHDEAMQEAYILEWSVCQKIQDLKHRENYFLKCVKNKIRSYGTSWWDTKRLKGETTDLELIDSLIEVRTFNELFYEHLVTDITFLLAQIDNTASELFQIRITTQKRWNAIRKDYPNLGFRRFYGYVGEIKRVVKQELCKVSNE